MAVSNPWSIIARNRPQLRRDMTRQIEHHFVHITPAPTFGWIIALDDGVLGVMEMLGGVLAARLVATADMATGAAHPQMKPFPAQFEAFLTAFAAGRHRLDRIKVG